ncbi:MAG: ATP-binding cassette domain-containing protein, partial [Candidatus Latescibacterota bacterium]
TWDIPEVSEDFLISRMVGRGIGDMFGRREESAGERKPVLEVDGFSRRDAFEDISFTVHAGEILGFAGLVGAGRTELARSLFGLELPDRGTLRLNGEPVSIHTARNAISHGIGYLTEDRKNQGLCLTLSVRENLIGPSLDRFTASTGLLSDSRITRFARETAERFNIVTPSLEHEVYSLSGGNQQKVLLGMWMGIDPKVLIADEPTRGVDVGAKEEIYSHLRALAGRGAAVMLISSDLKEILGMSDRICVMRGGRIAATVPSSGATEEQIISHALGAGEASA